MIVYTQVIRLDLKEVRFHQNIIEISLLSTLGNAVANSLYTNEMWGDNDTDTDQVIRLRSTLFNRITADIPSMNAMVVEEKNFLEKCTKTWPFIEGIIKRLIRESKLPQGEGERIEKLKQDLMVNFDGTVPSDKILKVILDNFKNTQHSLFTHY